MDGSLCQEPQSKRGKELGSNGVMGPLKFGAWGDCHWPERGEPLLVRKKWGTRLEEAEVKVYKVWATEWQDVRPRGTGS